MEQKDSDFWLKRHRRSVRIKKNRENMEFTIVNNVNCSLWRDLQSWSQAPWSVMLFHIVVFLALVPLFLGFFIWGLGQGTLWHFCQGHLMKGKRWNPEETFCHSDSVPSTFPLLSQPPHPLSTSEFIILKQPSVWDSLNICADPFDPQLVHHFILWGDEMRNQHFPWF